MTFVRIKEDHGHDGKVVSLNVSRADAVLHLELSIRPFCQQRPCKVSTPRQSRHIRYFDAGGGGSIPFSWRKRLVRKTPISKAAIATTVGRSHG